MRDNGGAMAPARRLGITYTLSIPRGFAFAGAPASNVETNCVLPRLPSLLAPNEARRCSTVTRELP